jgi:hypothetical protein
MRVGILFLVAGRLRILTFAALLAAAEAHTAQVTAVWSGGAGNSDWSNPANWDIGAVPNNGSPPNTTYHVVISTEGRDENGSECRVDINPKIDSISISLEHTVVIENGKSLTIVRSNVETGSIANAGTIVIDGSTLPTELRIDGFPVSLSGNGSIELSSSALSRVAGGIGINQLVNLDNAIRGSGQLGADTLLFVNYGTITADQPQKLVIDPPAGAFNSAGFVNRGTVRVQSGATLELARGKFDNSEGSIQVDSELAASTLFLERVEIHGGLIELIGQHPGRLRMLSSQLEGVMLSNDESGIIELPTGRSAFSGVLSNLAGGVLRIENGARLTLASSGTYINGGSIELNATLLETQLEFVGTVPVTLTGGGEIRLSNSTFNRITGGGGARLINQDNTIAGTGHLGSGLLPLTNHGTILLEHELGLRIDSGFERFDNKGFIRVEKGSVLTLGSFTNLFQTDGSLVVDGRIEGGGIIDLRGGRVSGTGTIATKLANSAAVAPGDSRGTLTIGGDYAQDSSGRLEIAFSEPTRQIASTTLRLDSSASLDGTLSVSVPAGFAPAPGQRFTLVDKQSTGAIQGMFMGLPEGAELFLDADRFCITYRGGDGNDVEIIAHCRTLPAAPLSIYQQLAVHALLTAGAVLWLRRRRAGPGTSRIRLR